jgi:hypothetical protein
MHTEDGHCSNMTVTSEGFTLDRPEGLELNYRNALRKTGQASLCSLAYLL